MNNYVVYHLHDDTSNCNGYYDSTTKFKDYIKLAKKNNMQAIALSNHGGIYDWVIKKSECDKLGIKYIHGVELYLCTELERNNKGYHVGLYAKNYDGVKELNSLVSIATSKGNKENNVDRHFYRNPRISLNELMNTSENIIITTACLASILWRCQYTKKPDDLSEEDRNEQYNHWLENRDRFLNWMSKNSHRCFLEIQYHNCDDQIEYNKMLYEWSVKYNVPLIAGTDTHSSNDYKAKCRIILQNSQKKNKDKSMDLGYEDGFDLIWKTYDELVESFKIQNSLPEEVYMNAIHNTNVFANLVEDFKFDTSFKYPNLYEKNVTEIWKDTILKKFNDKKDKNIINILKLNEYKEKIKEEFEAMKKQGMESFMLFMSDLVDYCNNNDIPYGFCRGSVGGSEVAYITDVIDVDPIIWNTVFSRFCNSDRISLADIDMDFAPEDRVKVYKYIIDRFSPKKTAYIAQFGTLKDRGTIDTLARGLNYKDLEMVDYIKDEYDKLFGQYSSIIQEEVNIEELEVVEAKSIDFDYHRVYCERIRNKKAIILLDKLKQAFDELKLNNKDLFYYFDGLKGTIISKGNHPAGMIGSPISIPDNLGVFYKDGSEDFPVCQCAMKAVDSLNYVKFDILGLKTVGIIKDTYKYINSHYLKSHEIDWNDENVWSQMIDSRVGVFQFESNFAFDLLKEFKPRFINDMSLVNASLRPSGKSYRNRLIKREFNNNPSKEIDGLLKYNHGYLVYQEDTIKFLTDICDFSGSEADTIRRAIGKKDIEVINEYLPKILKGYCNHSNKPYEVAEEEVKQFLQIIDDSSEYQFGYNHATGYSMNGYVCTMLRTHYPLEFVTAYLNRADNEEDIVMGTELAKSKGISINPIKFRYSKSEYAFDKDTNSIYKGIASIKHLSKNIADELYSLRSNNYDSFYKLLVNLKTKTSINSRQLAILISLNFFSEFGKNKKLLQYSTLFDTLYEKKQLSKTKALELNVDIDIVKQYSRPTDKTYMDLNTERILLEMWNSIEDNPLTLKEQISAEIEFLNYIEFIEPRATENFYVVTEYKVYKDKCKPYITLYQLKTGKTIKTKVKDSKYFMTNPFTNMNVLKVLKFKDERKNKLIDGKWVKSDDKEQILAEWQVI